MTLLFENLKNQSSVSRYFCRDSSIVCRPKIFDSIGEMHAVYDQNKGHTALTADAAGWRLED